MSAQVSAPDTSLCNTVTMAKTLLLDINSLFNDEDIADICLVPQAANDDAIAGVPAIKAILAARSPVFRRMLYGDFRETRASTDGKVEVRLEYSGRVLSLLVEFVFTDQLASLDSKAGAEGEAACTLEEKARLLTNLSGAAHYFDIPKLEIDIKVKLRALMLEHASVACAILDEASKMVSGEELVLLAIERVRARPKAALLHWSDGVPAGGAAGGNTRGGVTALNASLLEQVIFDEQSTASELTKFLCLQKWVEGCQHQVTADDVDSVDIPRKTLDADEIVSSRTPQSASRKQMGPASKAPTNPTATAPPCPASKAQNDEAPSAESQHQRRLGVVKRLAEKLDLSLVPASDLSTTITESRLISTHDLYQAYRLQALNAERTKATVFVEGAGLSAVNGTYSQRGVHEGTPMYNKEGAWQDREEVFRIFLCTYSNGNKSWCLSIVPKGKEPGKTTDLDFYECPVSYGATGGGAYSAEQGVGGVPTRGWKLVQFGQLPVPNCSLIAGCLEDGP